MKCSTLKVHGFQKFENDWDKKFIYRVFESGKGLLKQAKLLGHLNLQNYKILLKISTTVEHKKSK